MTNKRGRNFVFEPPQDLNDILLLAKITGEELSPLLTNHKRMYRRFESLEQGRRFYDPNHKLRRVLGPIGIWLNKYPLSEHVDGWRKGRSHLHTAGAHTNKMQVSKVDIKAFFPSIHSLRVQSLFKDRLNCGDEASAILTKLTTADSHLPQGFPTSPVIANLTLKSLDAKLSKYSQSHATAVRRYGDDITASSNVDIPNLAEDICGLVRRSGFTVNAEKLAEGGTRYADQEQEVCGIVVNDGLRISDTKYKAYLDELEEPMPSVLEISAVGYQALRRRREGILAYVRSVNPVQASLLLRAALDV